MQFFAPSMKKVSVSLTHDHVSRLDERQERGDADSRSAAVRDILDEYDAVHTECEELRSECERLRTRLESREQRIDELEEQLARRSQVEEKVDTLAKRVEDQDEPAPPFPVRWWRWVQSRSDASP